MFCPIPASCLPFSFYLHLKSLFLWSFSSFRFAGASPLYLVLTLSLLSKPEKKEKEKKEKTWMNMYVCYLAKARMSIIPCPLWICRWGCVASFIWGNWGETLQEIKVSSCQNQQVALVLWRQHRRRLSGQ